MATETQDNRGRNQYSGPASKSGSNGQQPAAQKRAMTKVMRVLNEIEHRIHELREELAEQTGTSIDETPGTRSRSRAGHDDEGDDTESNGQGRVKNPETDGRLKQNRDDDSGDEDAGRSSGRSGGRSMQPGVPGNKAGTLNRGRTQRRDDEHDEDDDVEAHGQGRVKHPESDGRLKQNRD